MSHIRERSGLTPRREPAIVIGMARFHLYWVRTRRQWDDGFVVARTSRAAACYVRYENFAFDPEWANAQRVTTLPDHLQDASVAVESTLDDPRHVHWASPEVLSACDVIIVHTESPRVFLWNEELFTEGVLDYVHHQQELTQSEYDPASASPTGRADDDIIGHA